MFSGRRGFRYNGDLPRPPLVGQVIGWAIGLTLLAGAVYLSIRVILAVLALVMPLLLFIGLCSLLFGRHRR
jgi:hypothetical protein